MADFNADDVPPLEDMSELLDQVQHLRSNQKTSSVTSSSSSAVAHVQNLKPVRAVTTVQDDERKDKASNTKTTTSASFGGMKKGFLFGATPKPKSAKKTAPPIASSKAVISNDKTDDDIPLIKPKMGKVENEIAEVQEALKANSPMLQNTEWVTDDLLKKFDQNPTLLRQLSDPRMSEAMAKFQRNPQLAMQEYQDNQEIQQFFKDFCAILGNHFEKLGGSTPSSTPPTQFPSTQGIQTHNTSADISVHSSTNPKQATAADEAKMQQILSDPEIRDIMQDDQIQKLFTALRSSPDEAQRMLQKLGPEVQQKVQKLVNVGLLGVNSR